MLYQNELSEEYKCSVWAILHDADKEFVPPFINLI